MFQKYAGLHDNNITLLLDLRIEIIVHAKDPVDDHEGDGHYRGDIVSHPSGDHQLPLGPGFLCHFPPTKGVDIVMNISLLFV